MAKWDQLLKFSAVLDLRMRSTEFYSVLRANFLSDNATFSHRVDICTDIPSQ